MSCPSPDPDFFARMAAVVTRRYQANADLSLREVYDLSPAFLDTQSDEDFSFHHPEKILAILGDADKFDAMLDLFVKLTVEFTYASNQFI
ncbi:MAG TPA: hypothetical protein VHO48_16490, partial [Anaerolineaceae bacterium]|nr:hypothetical protein [Anaerolineaceae bacterium]